MCGRYTLSATGGQVAERFDIADTPQLTPRYNIAPTQAVPLVRVGPEGRELALLRWGLVPSWAKDLAIGAKMINARSETVAEKPSFRAALRQRRCLILADGFYEWQAAPGGKQPFYFRVHAGAPFAMAGLWESWRGPDDVAVQTCTILTTRANPLLAPLHDRMPVILPPDEYRLWLDPDMREAGPLEHLFEPFPAEAMESYPVGKGVNRVANDSAALIAPLG
ncbi:SOS response-associated peptidase [Chloroflexales bacterium ZM16-3]|nr:SOS response-associated peptidase [Chloroflexales bacterium ZM16-3]